MKTLALIITLTLTNLIATAQDPQEGITLTVHIENVMNDNGKVLATLHNSETFMKGAGVDYASADSKKGQLTLTFENITPGEYAVMLLHDENNNKQMDFEANGMPKENYATSGSMQLYGPPTFDASKFEVTDEDIEFNIRF